MWSVAIHMMCFSLKVLLISAGQSKTTLCMYDNGMGLLAESDLPAVRTFHSAGERREPKLWQKKPRDVEQLKWCNRVKTGRHFTLKKNYSSWLGQGVQPTERTMSGTKKWAGTKLGVRWNCWLKNDLLLFCLDLFSLTTMKYITRLGKGDRRNS